MQKNNSVPLFVFTPAQVDWLHSLRSGRYRQTCRELSSNGAFCCLGVGAQRAEKAGIRVTRHMTNGFLKGNYLEEQPWTQDYLGLSSKEGIAKKPYMFRGKMVQHSLAELNDMEGATFKEIAGVLEHNPETFFVCSHEQLAAACLRDIEKIPDCLAETRAEMAVINSHLKELAALKASLLQAEASQGGFDALISAKFDFQEDE